MESPTSWTYKRSKPSTCMYIQYIAEHETVKRSCEGVGGVGSMLGLGL